MLRCEQSRNSYISWCFDIHSNSLSIIDYIHVIVYLSGQFRTNAKMSSQPLKRHALQVHKVFMHWIFSQIDQKMAPELFTIQPKIWPDALNLIIMTKGIRYSRERAPEIFAQKPEIKTFQPQYLVPIVHKILHSY